MSAPTAVPALPDHAVLFYQPATAAAEDRSLPGAEPYFDTYPVVAWLVGPGQCDPVTVAPIDWTAQASAPPWRVGILYPDTSVLVPSTGRSYPNSRAWALACGARDNSARGVRSSKSG